MAANQALKSNRFYILWIIFFINIACGLGLISAASPMAQEMAGLSTSHAAVMGGRFRDFQWVWSFALGEFI